jgi:hypothetical protein
VTQGAPEPAEPAADFTGESATSLPPGPSIADKIAEARERVRGWLAITLVALLALLDAAILALAVAKVTPFNHDLLDILLAGVINPVVVLVGTMLGFYFGEKSGKGTA